MILAARSNLCSSLSTGLINYNDHNDIPGIILTVARRHDHIVGTQIRWELFSAAFQATFWTYPRLI
jgi:hypothetical protein